MLIAERRGTQEKAGQRKTPDKQQAVKGKKKRTPVLNYFPLPQVKLTPAHVCKHARSVPAAVRSYERLEKKDAKIKQQANTTRNEERSPI